MSPFLTIVCAILTAGVPLSFLIAAAGKFYVVSTVAGIVNEANAKQTAELNVTYVRSMSSSLTGAEIGRLISETKDDVRKLRDAMAQLELYAHGKIHDLNNLLQRMQPAK